MVVEGYLDVIALWQYDIPYAVATLGTALTVDHARVLSRYTKNIIALFDGDDAGQKAAARSFEIFVEAGLFGRAAFLPKGDDPDSFVRRHGKAALETVLDEAVSLADYYFSWLERRFGKSLEGKSQIATEVSRVLAKVNNPFRSGFAGASGGRYVGNPRRTAPAPGRHCQARLAGVARGPICRQRRRRRTVTILPNARW